MKYLEENAQAANIGLSEEDMTEIKQLVQKFPNIGDRYNKYDFEFVNKQTVRLDYTYGLVRVKRNAENQKIGVFLVQKESILNEKAVTFKVTA